tara:strand:+ start:2110 stop:4176 length:2067 start_codon:yes stop_codon:yes gene_type:complete
MEKDIIVRIEELMDLFDDDEVTTANKIERPQSSLDRDAIRDFNIRNSKAGGGMLVQPSADGSRPGYAKATSVQKLGPRDKIKQLGVGDEILEMYKKGAGTIEIGKKYGISKDTVNRFIKQTNPNLLRESLPKVNQYNFDYSIIDKIKEDAKTMSRKEILKKYEGKISKKKLDSLKLTFGKVEEAGRPRILEGERSPKLVKRANRIKTVQGFDVSGTFAKNFHHIYPIGGTMKLNPNDVMILDKKFNEILGGFNLRLNDIADEIVTLDFSDPDSLKKLNDLNAESKAIIARAKAKLPKNLQNVIGYVEYQPVFDSNGTVVELSYVRRGVDQSPDTLKNFGVKNFKDFSKEERSLFKKEVQNAAKFAEKTGKISLKLNQVKDLDKADLIKFARIGCPGKATGGRIGYFEGQNLTACATKGAEKLKNNPLELTGGDQQNLRALSKSAKTLRFLKNFLGPGAVVGELVFEGGVAANKFLNEGMPIKQALGESYINKYLLGEKLKINLEEERKKELLEREMPDGTKIMLEDTPFNIARGEEFAAAKRGERMFLPQGEFAIDRRLKNREDEMKALYPQLKDVNLSNERIDEILKEQNVFSPFSLGFGMQQMQPGIGDTKYNEDVAYQEIRDLINQAVDEDIQSQQFQNIADEGGVANLAGGGIAKIAGVDSGPPPESGPMSQGLQGLMKRGIKG